MKWAGFRCAAAKAAFSPHPAPKEWRFPSPTLALRKGNSGCIKRKEREAPQVQSEGIVATLGLVVQSRRICRGRSKTCPGGGSTPLAWTARGRKDRGTHPYVMNLRYSTTLTQPSPTPALRKGSSGCIKRKEREAPQVQVEGIVVTPGLIDQFRRICRGRSTTCPRVALGTTPAL